VETDTETADPVRQWPRIVAVVVTHDPPSALEATLASLAVQDYPELSVVVIGGAEDADPEGPTMGDIVGGHLPDAVTLRLVGTTGFGALANETLTAGAAADIVADADYLLFCQDDVVLDPTAVHGLAEAAIQTGAGVVGPKVVDAADPRRLLHMGITCTATGVVVPLVERSELDQGQHDGQREVFAVSGGALLVAGRLFRRIGGFDEAITWLGDTLSLCWRARLAGARVVVTSAARARHGEVLRDRVSESAWRQLTLRHRIRLVATCTGRLRRWALLPVLAVVAVLSSCAALLGGRFGEAARLAAAWPWNLRRWWSVLIARRQVRRFRRVKDRALRPLQVSGLSLLALHFQRDRRARGVSTDGSGATLPASNGARRNDVAGRWQAARRQLTAWSPGAVVAALGLVGTVLVGSRHLLTRGVPQIGDLVAFESPRDLAHGWWTGWRPIGMGTDVAVPALQPALAAAGTLAGGHMGLLRTLRHLPPGLRESA
jgi:GT2 family glycosyltransferase